ncbi:MULTISPECIES: LysR family transcriptional regulator [unclassified Variovorax]|jgi:DNA-binding transcriptional LysR family regulator|uniref:LysR family transcriptional regulator n=1 Tax=unclassified Variovorax TaxID=663243 RepID=UPI000F7F20F9|nr:MULTISPECIES: LysR family transcriptional regulator [unclassified Variovorax]RSZ47399.1 LysR family transcriptional regulator [Variovorax sp. 553]RSZ48477.1 LysR family transcriptional regulator [Variovorax sp. 679]
MNLTMLVTLRTILEQGSFTAAAGVVGCSPSAVSLQVKQLEQYFGRPLFDRSTRVVVPTDFARDVVSAVGDFSHRLQMLRSRPVVEVAGRIRVGVITSMQSDVLPQALHALRQKHPSLDVVVPPLNDSDEMISELKAARLDVALLVRPESGGSRRLVWQELHRQPYVLLAPPNAPGKTVRQLLETCDWIGYDLSLSGGRVAARYVRSLKPDARCVMELRSMDAIVAMVAQGLGVSVVPQPRRPLVDAYAVREVGLGSRAPFRKLSLVWRNSDEGSRNVEAVAQAFATAFGLQRRP